MMIEESLFTFLDDYGLGQWQQQLRQMMHERFSVRGHGNFMRWKTALERMPHEAKAIVHCNHDTLTVVLNEEIDHTELRQTLQKFIPWRQGPFRIGEILINSEWRSDYKWNRLAPHIDFMAKSVLDVGCGNGYFMWRILAAGAKHVFGIDPSILFSVQFHAIKGFFATTPDVWLAPVGIEHMPPNNQVFDVVLSMGVLYHRRSPIDYLLALKGCLKPGGELLLETLVLDGGKGEILLPSGRYAQMRNVWFIPTATELERWLGRCGFHHIHCLDITRTSIKEQRSTEWMPFSSLPHFLDSSDTGKTIEGYPAPKRAIFLAKC